MNTPYATATPRPLTAPAVDRAAAATALASDAASSTIAAYEEAVREVAYRFALWSHLIRRRSILRASAPGRRAEPRTDALPRVHAALNGYRAAVAAAAELEQRMSDESRRFARSAWAIAA